MQTRRQRNPHTTLSKKSETVTTSCDLLPAIPVTDWYSQSHDLRALEGRALLQKKKKKDEYLNNMKFIYIITFTANDILQY